MPLMDHGDDFPPYDIDATDPEVFERQPLFKPIGRGGYPIAELTGMAYEATLCGRLDAIRDEQDVEDDREYDGECS